MPLLTLLVICLPRLRRDLDTLRSVKSRLLTGEERLRNMKWEYEVAQQQFARLKAERDDLFDKFQDALYDVQQKAGFKGLLLEKKLVVAQSELEKKESQLTEVCGLVHCMSQLARRCHVARFLRLPILTRL